MSHHLFFILAQSASPAGQPGPGQFLNSFVPIAAIFIVFYFVFIRPQSLQRKQHDALIKAVKTGDKIVTSSGIHGMVTNVKDSTVIVKIADNVKIELEKSSVATVAKRDEPESASAS
jgi:preprotein translocase subunit YajC